MNRLELATAVRTFLLLVALFLLANVGLVIGLGGGWAQWLPSLVLAFLCLVAQGQMRRLGE